MSGYLGRLAPTRSQKRQRNVTCPQCTSEHEVLVWTFVDAEDVEATNDLIAQRLNVFVCPQCRCTALLDVSLTYVDRVLGYCVQYVCKRDVSRDGFYTNMNKQGCFILHPAEPGTEGVASEHLARTHIVFSMREVVAYIQFRNRCAELGL